MEYQLLKEINFSDNINRRVFATFMAKDVSVSPQKNGKSYINLTMVHKDVEINAKKFEASKKEIDMVQNGMVYNAAIDISPYEKSPTGWSCKLYNIEPNTVIKPSQMVEWSDWLDDAYNVVKWAFDFINESIYAPIVYSIVNDKWTKFCMWTAASGQHHTKLGGLLVHTAEVIRQCNIMAEFWNTRYNDSFINEELLISAALLHDIGKVEELEVDANNGLTEYSTNSSLSSHIMNIISEVDLTAYKLDIGYDNEEAKDEKTLAEQKEAISLLKHLLASHHGKLEYGSPIVPNVPEANILNKADELSAEMYKYNKDFMVTEKGTSTHVWNNNGISITYKDSTKV